jgi:hypothetical protein
MYLGSDVDTDPTRREGINLFGGRLTSRGKGTYRRRPRGLRGWRPRYGHSFHGMRMTVPPEWPVSTMRWAFAACLSRKTWPMRAVISRLAIFSSTLRT